MCWIHQERKTKDHSMARSKNEPITILYPEHCPTASNYGMWIRLTVFILCQKLAWSANSCFVLNDSHITITTACRIWLCIRWVFDPWKSINDDGCVHQANWCSFIRSSITKLSDLSFSSLFASQRESSGKMHIHIWVLLITFFCNLLCASSDWNRINESFEILFPLLNLFAI